MRNLKEIRYKSPSGILNFTLEPGIAQTDGKLGRATQFTMRKREEVEEEKEEEEEDWRRRKIGGGGLERKEDERGRKMRGGGEVKVKKAAKFKETNFANKTINQSKRCMKRQKRLCFH